MPFLGDIFKEVIYVFPVFPLALLGSLLIRFFLEKLRKEEYVSEILQREIGVLSTDLLITTAMAGLNLPLLLKDWIPLTVLAFSGIVLPPLTPSSAVIIYSDSQSFTLPEIESAEKPPKIIE